MFFPSVTSLLAKINVSTIAAGSMISTSRWSLTRNTKPKLHKKILISSANTWVAHEHPFLNLSAFLIHYRITLNPLKPPIYSNHIPTARIHHWPLNLGMEYSKSTSRRTDPTSFGASIIRKGKSPVKPRLVTDKWPKTRGIPKMIIECRVCPNKN